MKNKIQSKTIIIDEIRAHEIFGAFSVCCSEGIDGIELSVKSRIELHKLNILNEDLITEIAKIFPDIAEKYFYVKDQIE